MGEKIANALSNYLLKTEKTKKKTNMYRYVPVVTKPLAGDLMRFIKKFFFFLGKNSYLTLITSINIYLDFSILELKEQVVFHSCSQKQQPASPACFNLE